MHMKSKNVCCTKIKTSVPKEFVHDCSFISKLVTKSPILAERHTRKEVPYGLHVGKTKG